MNGCLCGSWEFCDYCRPKESGPKTLTEYGRSVHVEIGVDYASGESRTATVELKPKEEK